MCCNIYWVSLAFPQCECGKLSQWYNGEVSWLGHLSDIRSCVNQKSMPGLLVHDNENKFGEGYARRGCPNPTGRFPTQEQGWWHFFGVAMTRACEERSEFRHHWFRGNTDPTPGWSFYNEARIRSRGKSMFAHHGERSWMQAALCRCEVCRLSVVGHFSCSTR